MNQQEWRNQASLANYPFVSSASRIDITGSSEIKKGDIVDAHLVARTSLERNLHVSRLEISSLKLEGTITSNLGEFGTFSIGVGDLPGGTARVVDSASVDRGVIIFGREDESPFDLLNTGETFFSPTALQFHDAVVFMPPVNRVATLNINDTPLYGRVRFKAGTGIRFELLNEGDKDVVVVHAVGAQIEQDCGSGTPIKNFNSAPPDEHGTIFIRPAPYMTPEQASSLRQLLRVRADDDRNAIVISIAELDS